MTKTTITKSVFILACLFGVTTVSAQFTQTAKIVSPNREGRAEFGTSVDIAENFAIVGTSREMNASGAAYIYSKDGGGVWSFSQRLAATDPNDGAEFGGGVAFSDDYVVVAAGRADIGANQRAGALYVYDYQNNNWEFSTKLVASDVSSEAKLGMNPTSLDVEGNTIIGGAPGDNQWTGSVYVFTKNGGVWTETQKILSPNPQLNDVFGIGVSISGDYLVVGASETSNRKGAAYVYIKNGAGIWEYNQTLMASDAANDDFFGTSVSLSGDQLVIGAYGASQETGAAYIFEKDSAGTWVEVQKLTGNASPEAAQFGWDTDIRQDYILVSAPHIYGVEVSEVYAYKRNGSGTWEENQIIQSATTTDFYSWSIAMKGTQLISGAPRDDFDENGENEMGDAGAAYILNNPTLGGLSNYEDITQISLYPNPTSNIVNIESSASPIANLKVYAITGSLLKEVKNVNNSLTTLDISNYAQGVYFVNITLENGGSVVQKIIKTN